MSVQFFGQFLIEQGEIDAGDLREALEYMQARNATLGELAIAEGLLAPEDTRRLNAEQRLVDQPFGALAVACGLLSSADVERLLRRQRETRVPVGEALVALGFLPASRLGALLDRFKAEQKPFETGGRTLPGSLAGVRAAALVLDLLPRFCMRVARLHVKLAPSHAVGSELAQRVSLRLRGVPPLDLGLAADSELALSLAAGISGLPRESVDAALTSDALGEFLNVLVGNAAGALEREGIDAELELMRVGALPDTGEIFELVAPRGRGALILAAGAA